MTEHDRDHTESDEPLRPIPDGGLATTLPEWLKERPTWSVTTTNGANQPPDTSAIDPRLLVREQDLPNWLQAIARRENDAPYVVDRSAETDPPVAELQPAKPPTPSRSLEELIPPAKPEWMTHAAGQSLIPAESTADLQRWLTDGEDPAPRRKTFSDPVLLGFIAAGLLVIAVAVYLILSSPL